MRVAIVTLALVALPMSSEGQATATPLRVAPATLPRIATVDERYQSYNVEMAEVIGGNFWKPYTQRKHRRDDGEGESAAESGRLRKHDADASRCRHRHLSSTSADRPHQRAAPPARGGPRTRIRAGERIVGELGVFPRRGHARANDRAGRLHGRVDPFGVERGRRF